MLKNVLILSFENHWNQKYDLEFTDPNNAINVHLSKMYLRLFLESR